MPPECGPNLRFVVVAPVWLCKPLSLSPLPCLCCCSAAGSRVGEEGGGAALLVCALSDRPSLLLLFALVLFVLVAVVGASCCCHCHAGAATATADAATTLRFVVNNCIDDDELVPPAARCLLPAASQLGCLGALNCALNRA